MFGIFLVFFVWFRIASPVFQNSLFAIFIIVNYFIFMTGGSVYTLLAILTRTLPLETLVFWGASRIGVVAQMRG